MSDLERPLPFSNREVKRISGDDSCRGEMNLGIQLAGRAEKIEGSRHDLALKHYAKRKKPEPEERQDVLGGDAWYRLVPQQLYLIDEESFGFERQQVI